MLIVDVKKATSKIPTKVKNAGIAILTPRGTPKRQIKPLLWAGCVLLLPKGHLGKLAKEPGKIVLDNEFEGHQRVIKPALLAHIRPRYDQFPGHKIVIGSVLFGYIDTIGQNSSTHKLAWATRRRKRPVDRVVTQEELLKILA